MLFLSYFHSAQLQNSVSGTLITWLRYKISIAYKSINSFTLMHSFQSEAESTGRSLIFMYFLGRLRETKYILLLKNFRRVGGTKDRKQTENTLIKIKNILFKLFFINTLTFFQFKNRMDSINMFE